MATSIIGVGLVALIGLSRGQNDGPTSPGNFPNQPGGSTVRMTVYYDKLNLCNQPNTGSGFTNPQNISYQFNGPYAPSCQEIFNYFDDTPTSKTIDQNSKCYSSPTNLGYAQDMGLFDSLGAGNPGGNTYYGSMGNFSAFKIISCSEGASRMGLYRPPDQLDESTARNCFFLPGTTNETSTLPAVRSTETLVVNFNSFSVNLDDVFRQAYSFSLGGSSISTVDGSITWNIDPVASGLARTVPSLNGFDTVNIFDTQKTYTLKYNLQGSTNTPAGYLAYQLTVVMNSDTVTISFQRNLSNTPSIMWDMNAQPCEFTYDVMTKTGGRNWGQFYTTKPKNLQVSKLTRSSVGKATTRGFSKSGFGYQLIAETVDDGCMYKCTQSINVWSPGTGYNPFYTPSTLLPSQVMARCYDGTTSGSFCSFPFVESNYKNSDCLCGQLLGLLSFPADYVFGVTNVNGAGDPDVVTAAVTMSALSGLSPAIDDMVMNYTVSSGDALGSHAEADNGTAVLAGSVVGGLIAAIVFIVLFFVFSKPLSGKSSAIGASMMQKTKSPLSGLQVLLLFLASAFIIGATFSPEGVTVIVPTSTGGPSNTFSLGVWFQISASGAVGSLSGSGNFFAPGSTNGEEQYSCNLLLLTNPGTGGDTYDWTYVNYCVTVRASACVAVAAGVLAVAFGVYNRQRIIFPLLIVAVLSSIIALGVFKTQIVDGWWNSVVPSSATYVYGTGFHLMIAAVFFFLLELIGWSIDWLSMEDAE